PRRYHVYVGELEGDVLRRRECADASGGPPLYVGHSPLTPGGGGERNQGGAPRRRGRPAALCRPERPDAGGEVRAAQGGSQGVADRPGARRPAPARPVRHLGAVCDPGRGRGRGGGARRGSARPWVLRLRRDLSGAEQGGALGQL